MPVSIVRHVEMNREIREPLVPRLHNDGPVPKHPVEPTGRGGRLKVHAMLS